MKSGKWRTESGEWNGSIAYFVCTFRFALSVFRLTKHFTATAFIVDSQNRTLLLWHKRLQRWMPPGGHVDENETPQETAARECKEETGLDVEILGLGEKLKKSKVEKLKILFGFSNFQFFKFSNIDLFASCPEEGHMLKNPIAMLQENIPECPDRNEPAHQHTDFLFLARPLDEAQELVLAEDEGEDMQWFTKEDIEALDDSSEIFGNVKAYILSVL